uniref:Ig-like domain-containing protein n=1 Tax=Varanus komodoensis TaxID=61221 RepID=A0A8D2L5F9_VARKO
MPSGRGWGDASQPPFLLPTSQGELLPEGADCTGTSSGGNRVSSEAAADALGRGGAGLGLGQAPRCKTSGDPHCSPRFSAASRSRWCCFNLILATALKRDLFPLEILNKVTFRGETGRGLRPTTEEPLFLQKPMRMSLFAGAVGQEVVQPQAVIEVQAGATLILGCSVMGATLRGPVKWFLGEGPARKLIYAEIGSFERVLRTNKDSNTDFSIAIQNVTQADDAGTYYCVKQKKDLGGDKDVKTGPGTRVAVNPQASAGLWSTTLVSQLLLCWLEKSMFLPCSKCFLLRD